LLSIITLLRSGSHALYRQRSAECHQPWSIAAGQLARSSIVLHASKSHWPTGAGMHDASIVAVECSMVSVERICPIITCW
jgi:hypothetical protein